MPEIISCDPESDSYIPFKYSSGTLHVIPLSKEEPYLQPSGSASLEFTGTGPDKERQEASHPHQVIRHPDREEVLVPDLGADKVWRLTKNEKGIWSNAGSVNIKAGGGPRHVTFYSTNIPILTVKFSY